MRAKSWRKWILFWIEFQLLSIWMCRKHNTQMLRFHSWITSFNCAWKCAAAVWTGILIVLVLPCNWIFFISPFHDVLLFVWWQLRNNNSALYREKHTILYRKFTFLNACSSLTSGNDSFLHCFSSSFKVNMIFESAILQDWAYACSSPHLLLSRAFVIGTTDWRHVSTMLTAAGNTKISTLIQTSPILLFACRA